MAHNARYTTFRDGELEAQLRALGARSGYSSSAPTAAAFSSIRGSRLRKAHACAVHFPDGTDGVCHYERGGPAWHLFRYERPSPTGTETLSGPKEALPKQYWSKPLGNDPASIEAKAQELTANAFQEAITREQREFFMRASEGAGRRKNPALFAMTAAKAKKVAGHYALCRKLGTKLVPLGPTFSTLEEATTAWRSQENCCLLIACCNRLDRCWQTPRFNTLHADPAYREAVWGEAKNEKGAQKAEALASKEKPSQDGVQDEDDADDEDDVQDDITEEEAEEEGE